MLNSITKITKCSAKPFHDIFSNSVVENASHPGKSSQLGRNVVAQVLNGTAAELGCKVFWFPKPITLSIRDRTCKCIDVIKSRITSLQIPYWFIIRYKLQNNAVLSTNNNSM